MNRVRAVLAVLALVVAGNFSLHVYDYGTDNIQEIRIDNNRTEIGKLTEKLGGTIIPPRIGGLPPEISIDQYFTFTASPRQPKFDNYNDFDCIVGFGENLKNISSDFREYLLKNRDKFTYKGEEIVLHEKLRPDVFIAPIVENGEINGIVWILDRGDSPPQVRYLEETYEKLNAFKEILERLCVGQ